MLIQYQYYLSLVIACSNQDCFSLWFEVSLAVLICLCRLATTQLQRNSLVDADLPDFYQASVCECSCDACPTLRLFDSFWWCLSSFEERLDHLHSSFSLLFVLAPSDGVLCYPDWASEEMIQWLTFFLHPHHTHSLFVFFETVFCIYGSFLTEWLS